jgi:hypothetical protein
MEHKYFHVTYINFLKEGKGIVSSSNLNQKTGQSQSHVTTDDQSVSKSWIRAPYGSRDRILISGWHLRVIVLSIAGAPSEEGLGLSFVVVIIRPLFVNIYRLTCNVHVSYIYEYIQYV